MEKIEADIFNILHNTKIRLQGDAEDNYSFMGKGYAEKLAIEIAKEIQPSEPLKELDEKAILMVLDQCCPVSMDKMAKEMIAQILWNKFGQPSEKKALDISEIIRLFQIFQLTDERNRPQTGIPDWNYNDLALAIFDALPARKEVKWPEEINVSKVPGINEAYWVGRINEMRDACIKSYEEAMPAHQYIEYLKSENESLRKFPPCGTAQREVRYPEKITYYHSKKEYPQNCVEAYNQAIDEFKKLNGDKT